MYAIPEKIVAAGRVSAEAGLAVAQAQFAAAEKLAALNIATAKGAFAQVSEHIHSVLGARDPQAFAKLNTEAAQPVIDNAITYARDAYTIATQAHSNVAKIVEAQSAEVNRALANAIENASENAPAGSEPAVNAAKAAFAALHSVYEGWAKVVKQSTQAAGVNFEDVVNASRNGAKRRAA